MLLFLFMLCVLSRILRPSSWEWMALIVYFFLWYKLFCLFLYWLFRVIVGRGSAWRLYTHWSFYCEALNFTCFSYILIKHLSELFFVYEVIYLFIFGLGVMLLYFIYCDLTLDARNNLGPVTKSKFLCIADVAGTRFDQHITIFIDI